MHSYGTWLPLLVSRPAIPITMNQLQSRGGLEYDRERKHEGWLHSDWLLWYPESITALRWPGIKISGSWLLLRCLGALHETTVSVLGAQREKYTQICATMEKSPIQWDCIFAYGQREWVNITGDTGIEGGRNSKSLGDILPVTLQNTLWILSAMFFRVLRWM